ncbi:MAG: energy-coupling factor transporter transmembrane protein EcfT [Gemmatimonadetes bacterium]|nr:energy-coupling factor transporter transmembrane protein EcfT [Gemmatimonadota bacterium]
MNVGYVAGRGPLHRSHPFTPLTLAATFAILAFVLPAPGGAAALCALALALALFEGVGGVLKSALLTVLPFWIFLFVIHAVIRGSPVTALDVASRITAIVIVFLTVLASVQPARLVDAMVDRGLPFSVAYLFAATLQAVPRLRQRAKDILDAQRCRGLAVRGSPWRRARALVPLAMPLILGALAEVDERSLALEARGAAYVVRRTPLHPPADAGREKMLRWGMLLLAVGSIVVKIAV